MKLVPNSEEDASGSAVTLSEDFKTIQVETDDISLQGKSISYSLKIESESVLSQKELIVTVEFDPIPLEFDKSELKVTPLSCGPKDNDWELLVPSVNGPSE